MKEVKNQSKDICWIVKTSHFMDREQSSFLLGVGVGTCIRETRGHSETGHLCVCVYLPRLPISSAKVAKDGVLLAWNWLGQHSIRSLIFICVTGAGTGSLLCSPTTTLKTHTQHTERPLSFVGDAIEIYRLSVIAGPSANVSIHFYRNLWLEWSALNKNEIALCTFMFLLQLNSKPVANFKPIKEINVVHQYM